MCDSKKLQLFKEQEASGLLSSLRVKIPLNRILFVDHLLFYKYLQFKTRNKMNEIVKRFLLAAWT